MKVIIVDKEEAFMKKTSLLIKKNLPSIEIIGLARNTQEAIRIVLDNPPDTALISTLLNDDDGFHVGEELKKIIPELGIIFYLEEEKTNDMKRAMDVGAIGLVQKPLNKKRIIPILEAVKRRTEKVKEQRAFLEKTQELSSKTDELIEFSFIYAILFSGDLGWNYNRYQEVFDVKGVGYVLYIAVDKEGYKGSSKIEYDKYARLIKNQVPEGYRCIVSSIFPRRIIVLVLAKQDILRERHLEQLDQVRFAETIKKTFSTIFGIHIRVGIGSERSIDKISVSYEEAMHDIRYGQLGTVMNDTDLEMKESQQHFYIGMEEEMLQAVRAGSNEAINNFRAILDILDRYHPEDKKNKIMELLVVIVKEARKEGKIEADYFNYLEIAKKIESLDSEEINAWACQNISNILNLIQEFQEERSFDGMRKILGYLEKHYHEDINLEEMSRMANISPQYFSRVFKEKTGSNFVEYLTKLRIQKAMEWFECSDKNIQEVCYNVGYKDPNYFTRVFKKINGVTPKQYIEQKRRVFL